jgi:hypothetical protein
VQASEPFHPWKDLSPPEAKAEKKNSDRVGIQ